MSPIFRIIQPRGLRNIRANVGEAYGSASAMLSATALLGIGASLLFQSRQMRHELIALDKQRHFEILKLGLDDPDFFRTVDQRLAENEHMKSDVYANIMMGYWLALWEVGEIAEAELRNLAGAMFVNEVPRRWWNRMRDSWITVTSLVFACAAAGATAIVRRRRRKRSARPATRSI